VLVAKFDIRPVVLNRLLPECYLSLSELNTWLEAMDLERYFVFIDMEGNVSRGAFW